MHEENREPTVLLVDDNDDFRLLWRLVLESDGGFGTIREAAGGRAAVEALEKERFDVVLTDYWMPEVSGFEVIDAAKRCCPDCLIVMASSTADVAEEAVQRGAAAFFTKFDAMSDRMPDVLRLLLDDAEARSLRS